MIYLLYGEEKYDLYKFLDKIKSEFKVLEKGINYFHINTNNINELDNIYETVTFFGGNKLVIIKDTLLKFDVKKLISHISKEDIYVIIENSIDKRTTAYKELSKNADIKEFKYLKDKEMTAYIIKILKLYKLNISYSDAQYMTEVCGEDKNNNINELKKLVGFLNEGDTVTKEIIDKVCSKTLNAKIFDMLDAAVSKEKGQAIKLLEDLLIQKEPAIKISIMLYKQVKQMYMIKYMKTKKVKDINTILEIHPFAFAKLNKSSDNYTLEYLSNLINKFDEYDAKTKVGELDFELGLKKIICLMHEKWEE